MKQFKSMVVIAIFAVTTVLSASTTPTKDTRPETLSEQVAALLDEPAFQVNQEITAQVTVMINSQKELVVLDVDTSDEKVQEFIKKRLNYQKVTVNSPKNSFVIPVRVVPGS